MTEAAGQSRPAANPGPPAATFCSRCPAIPAAAALAIGIALDRAFEPSPAVWMALTAMALTAAWAAFRTPPRHRATIPSAVSVLAALAGLGGLRHHSVWTARGARDVARLAIADDTPVRMRGVLDSAIEVLPPRSGSGTPPWQLQDRSVVTLRCEALLGPTEEVPITGRVRVDVAGHLLHARQGDRIELLGRLRIPQPPRSPADFDFRNWLRAKGIDRLVRVEHPQAVVRLGDAAGLLDRFGRFRAEIRTECDRQLRSVLSERTYPVGASLLIGTRTSLPEETRQAFIESGTMHLLAISGLHVGVLAGCVLLLCRALNLSLTATAMALGLTLWCFAAITDLRPPVLRAAVLGGLAAAALPGARARSGANLLGAAGLMLLVWNPCDLFDVGAQLSFLAVSAILWSAGILSRLPRRLDPILLDTDLSPWQRGFRRALRWGRDCWLVTAAIWLFTLPLTMAWFRIVSPVGFLLNGLLAPFSVPLLACGFATLTTGLLWPAAAVVPGALYEALLRCLLTCVERASEVRWGHWFVPGPTAAWLWTWYGLLLCGVLLRGTRWGRAPWRGLALLAAASLAIPLWTPARSGLRCTWIDVGHGGAILVECPDGRNLLYDAGTFAEPDRARRAIEGRLWDRGVRRLDAIVVSHADVDHYNAVVGLLEVFPVGGIHIARSFLDFQQLQVAELCEAASRHGTPLIVVQAGDRLLADPNVEIRVLHPAGGFADPLDNANSIVLEIAYSGRRLLLTGDVERTGLNALLATANGGRFDAFQAPHHGGRSANTSDLARWATPGIVIASSRDEEVVSRLRDVYVDAEQVLATATSGTIEIEILADGEVHVSTSLADPE
ncbi:MAG: ComEC/Rec2 family competence protein [Planctomyces sp.]|nr:ComEC/Rec2 family competence protein [Planctomyces sp.]